jgi:hypothetical protein
MSGWEARPSHDLQLHGTPAKLIGRRFCRCERNLLGYRWLPLDTHAHDDA